MTARIVHKVQITIKGRIELLDTTEAEALLRSLSTALTYTASTDQGGILNTVAQYYKIEVLTLLGRCRREHIAGARQVAMFLCRRFTPASYSEIGEYFKRDHGTVMHAVRTIEDRMVCNRKVKSDVDFLSEQIAEARKELAA